MYCGVFEKGCFFIARVLSCDGSFGAFFSLFSLFVFVYVEKAEYHEM